MKIRIFLFVLVILVAVVGYFFWSLKDKDLKLIPQNTDVVVLIDVKKTKEQYFLDWFKNPSQWFKESGNKVSLTQAGVKIPDYIQIFHLKDTAFSEWYSIFEITNKDDLLKFLKNQGFKSAENSLYKKDQISVKVESSRCVVGFSNSGFNERSRLILNSKNKNFYADQLINNTVASVSYFAKSKIHNFAVYLNDDNIEIKTKTVNDVFSSTVADLEKQAQFLQLHLDSKNAKIASEIFCKGVDDSVQINSIAAVADLEMVNDKIVSYSYDENFNQIEKVSYQKLVQPNYSINFESWEPQKLWSRFQDKKWINAQNQFTAIPFQPNLIEQKGNEIVIRSLRNQIEQPQKLSGSYVFIRNSDLLVSLIGSISKSEAKAISDLDYVFYGNKADYYEIKLKFKNNKLPFYLR
ncbi:hypothetical protein [Epilithonimonas arachidiradicis]|uniref:DUF3352 domain-containing protein n=1 Tax=Epilithonimonas arachidiradicis TaxID=1617282 RepID=A0A420DCK9_9FLAO|nr:hypothetical protein [Epilithonimonas arachidiradicis]RKE89534.1 hypothetical protein BXY58_0097 [Epilithonimonas arachidiradicis]GGG43224.1 hypothetical protein GCM10007332_00900 [Epilithonimonas arachidiradicis]